MKDTMYVYSSKSLFCIIQEIFLEYNVLPLSMNEINDNNFKNNNSLLVLQKNLVSEIKESFFLSNNVVVFLSYNQQSFDTSRFNNSKFFYGHFTVKKFVDEIKTCFIAKKIILKNIELFEDKVFNRELSLIADLTPLEKKILVVLFENKETQRSYLLEEILKIKTTIETKTIESHLTRIRSKLFKIKSGIKITSKEDIFYLKI